MRTVIVLTFGALIALNSTLLPADKASPSRSVRVAGIVLKWIRGDKEANYQRIEPLIREAAEHGARIVVTTECFLDGYAIQDKTISLETYRALGEKIPDGPYFQRLGKLARELKIHLMAGLTEAAGEERYNTVVLLGPDGSLLGKYRKQKLGHEAPRNTPGDISSIHQTPYGKLGMMICADRTNPDIVRKFRENGAEFLICSSGGMYGPKSNDHILQARSRENKLPIIFVHPAEFLVTGPEGNIQAQTVLGNSLLIDPAEIGTERDSRRIFYYELPISAAK